MGRIGSAAKIQKRQAVMDVDARASWGTAVLRPYTDVRDTDFRHEVPI
jgi:hypothetical protein